MSNINELAREYEAMNKPMAANVAPAWQPKPQVMICGVDCRQDDANCNGYCTGKTDNPPEASEALVLERAKKNAHWALDVAERAWYEYFGLCDVGPDRIRASEIYENVRRARMR